MGVWPEASPQSEPVLAVERPKIGLSHAMSLLSTQRFGQGTKNSRNSFAIQTFERNALAYHQLQLSKMAEWRVRDAGIRRWIGLVGQVGRRCLCRGAPRGPALAITKSARGTYRTLGTWRTTWERSRRTCSGYCAVRRMSQDGCRWHSGTFPRACRRAPMSR